MDLVESFYSLVAVFLLNSIITFLYSQTSGMDAYCNKTPYLAFLFCITLWIFLIFCPKAKWPALQFDSTPLDDYIKSPLGGIL